MARIRGRERQHRNRLNRGEEGDGSGELWPLVPEVRDRRRISDGGQPILDIQPTSLHQRTPLVIGSKADVALVERTLREAGEGGR